MDRDLTNAEAPAPKPPNRFKQFPGWLAGASTLLYVFSRFVPCAPPDAGRYEQMDLSWLQFLHQAFLEHLQFGRDVVFTFGPWGFLYGGYHPGTLLIAILAWTGLSLVFWWTGWKLARHLTGNLLGAWSWMVFFTCVAGTTLFCPNIDACLYAFVILLLALHFFVEDRPLTSAQTALTVSLALLGLVKASLLVLTIAVLVLIGADVALRRRKFPWLLPVFGGSVLIFWIAAGQRLSSFGPFITGSRLITGGYTEAMMLRQPTETRDVIFFLLAAALPFALTAYAGWTRLKLPGLSPAAGLGLILFTSFKYGYVRHDAHEVASALELLLVSLAALAVSWPVLRDTNSRIKLAALLQAAVILCFASIFYRHHAGRSLLGNYAQSISAPSLLAPVRLLGGIGHTPETYQRYLAACPTGSAIPAIQGSVDVYPWNDLIALPAGAHYCPRPIVQSYSAYSPELEELDAAYLRNDRAPEHIVWRSVAIDYHFPTFDDGRSWPELLTRYDIEQVECPFVLFRRSESPRHWKLVPLADQELRLGVPVALPDAGHDPIWAQIDVEQSLAGAISTAFYKPPVLNFAVAYRDGRQEAFRLIPGMARSGFLLSPVINGALSFAAFASGERHFVTNKEVALIMIANDGRPTFTGYKSPMRLRLFRLEFARRPAGKPEEFRRLSSLYDVAFASELVRAARSMELTFRPALGSVLAAPADSAIRVQVPEKAGRLKLGFGIVPSADAGARATNEIEFRVWVASESGQPAPFWSQRLDPARRDADCAMQHATVDFTAPPGSKVVLEILPGNPQQNGTLSCYWSEIQFE